MSVMYTLFGTLIALGLLIAIHEFGHFWVARRCGVKVLRFSIGFGKPLWSRTDAQGTEYSLSAIPLGGYVKMLDEREAPVPEDLLPQAFNRKPVLQRMAIVAAGPVANFLLAIFLYWVLALLGSEEPRPFIGTVQTDSLAAQAGFASGEEVVSVDGVVTPTWRDVAFQLMARLGESGVLRIEVREPGSHRLQVRDVLLREWQRDASEPDPLKSLGIKPWAPRIAPVLGNVQADSPAAGAGLRAGDRVLALNDTPVTDWMSLVEWVRQHPAEQITLDYMRDGKQARVSLQLATQTQDGRTQGYLGAAPQAPIWPPERLQHVSAGPLDAIAGALHETWRITQMTVVSLKKMIMGELSVKNLSGPVTIAKVAGASAESGLTDFLSFLALLSVGLGVFNLLPIPVLDGGHLVFYGIEGILRRPLSERVQTWGMQIGLTLMLGVMLLALFNDLSRL